MLCFLNNETGVCYCGVLSIELVIQTTMFSSSYYQADNAEAGTEAAILLAQ